MCFHLPNAHQTTFSLAERTEQRTCLKPNHKTMMAQGRLQQSLLDAGVYHVKKSFPTFVLMRVKEGTKSTTWDDRISAHLL